MPVYNPYGVVGCDYGGSGLYRVIARYLLPGGSWVMHGRAMHGTQPTNQLYREQQRHTATLFDPRHHQLSNHLTSRPRLLLFFGWGS